MSTTSPPTSGSPVSQTTGGTILRPFKAPSKSKSDWLAPAILTAKTITAAAECAPFPYIKGVSGTVLILLETVGKVKKNREDLEELCNSTTEIITILRDQIVTHGSTAAVQFKSLCEELESYLEAAVLAIRNLQGQSKGFRGRVREFVKSSSLTDEIVGYQKQIQGVCSNLKLMVSVETKFKVDEMHAIITAPSFAVVKAVQNINKCPPPSRIFQGRQAILDKMHQFFDTDSGKQHIYVLHGLGGAGKTQIALKFIEESSKIETIETALKSIAVSKSVGDSAQDTLMWLQSNHNKWLLFFDNADDTGWEIQVFQNSTEKLESSNQCDPKINLNAFFPQCNHGNIIITSRNPDLRSYGVHTSVSDMEEADATTLLLQRANKESSEENLELATEIAKELYCLPLAIVHAGAFISKSEDLGGYLVLYRGNRARLLSEKAVQSHDGYAWTVYTTWQISFTQLSKPAATLLQLCSFLHYTGISEDIFSNASKYSSWNPPKEELQEPLEFLSHFLGPTGEWNSLRFLDVTNEIKAYSLISFDVNTKLFSIHPLVYAWSRSILLDEEAFHSCMSSILGMCITEIPEGEIKLTSVRLMPHLVLLKGVKPDGVADFRSAFWRIYHNGGKFKDAQSIAEQVLQKSQLLLGEEHLETLQAMQNVASTYLALGEFQKAEALDVLVVEKRSKLLGDEHPDSLSAMGNLARTYSVLGEFQKALELEVVVLEKRSKLLGIEHPDTLSAMGNLARTYSVLGEFQKALELEVVVLEKRSKLLGHEHPASLLTMSNLARTYSDLGEFQKALELEVVVLEKRSKLLGIEHPDTLSAMGNLAQTYSVLGEFQKALELEVLVLEKRSKLLGHEHPNTLLAMSNLAGTYSDLGEFQKALELEVLVLEKRSKLLGIEHPATLSAMGNLAQTYSVLGEFQKALELEVVVLEKRSKLLGHEHPASLLTMGNLARTYSVLGEFQKALELEVLVLEKHSKLLGHEHPNTLLAMSNLAGTYSDLGEFQKALELEVLVLEKRSKLLGDEHPDTLLAMGNLARTYSDLGEFQKAEELEVAVLQKQRQLLGDKHPHTILAMQNLAKTYQALGKQEEMEELEQLIKDNNKSLQLGHAILGHPQEGYHYHTTENTPLFEKFGLGWLGVWLPPPPPRTEEEETLPSVEVVVPANAPSWLQESIKDLSKVDLGCHFGSVLVALIQLEGAAGFEVDEAERQQMPVGKRAGRPAVISAWIKGSRGTKTKTPPIVEDIDKFVKEWDFWWDAVQPQWRQRDNNGRWHVDEFYRQEWGALDCSGANGCLSAVAGLYFWGVAAKAGSEAQMARWDHAVQDVVWVPQGLRLLYK
ncbi:hypothetical protein C8F04DRAFT_1239575 [Mycena alexandri]|uniref:DUF7779 domain-containing protein n=1 Tax=Mycena alexandri TaxID=1745969 RepID=A0AAD6WTC5_9AGAR|nr:hypothetical protein C8F04DRAFT_1239575 [Mycena alexandri]